MSEPIPLNSTGSCCKKVCYILCFLLYAKLSLGQGLAVQDSISIIPFKGSPSQLVDKLSLTDSPFKKHTNSRIDLGFTYSTGFNYILFKLSTADSSAKENWLSIDNTSLDTVMIYSIAPEGSSLLYEGGSLVPYDNSRNYVWHTARLSLSPKPTFYLLAVKAGHKNINISYDILSADALQKKYNNYQTLVCIYSTILGTIAVIILLTWFLFRKAIFGAYLGYIVCTGGWILAHYGHLFPELFPTMPRLNEIIKPVATLGASLFLLLVLRMVFSDALAKRKRLLYIVKLVTSFLPVIITSMLFLLDIHLSYSARTILVSEWQLGLAVSIILIVFIPLHFFKTGYTARIFSLAALTICIMTLVQQIANFGYIKSFFINEHGVAMANIIEIAIMAFGLFYSFYQEKKQRDKQVFELEQERTETLKKLITVQDNERKRIAADLHDNLGPLLAALKINFRRIMNRPDNLQEDLVDKTESIIDDSIAEIRNVAHNLMPKGLSSNGLINTLHEYFENLEQLYSKNILFTHQIEVKLGAELQTNLYRIICELVLNAARHSKAAFINVDIKSSEQLVTLSIYDDGQGFTPKPLNDNQNLGLQSAESRVHYMKGAFNLQTKKGKGTMIDIEIPLTI